jgi:hypothetical protein
LREPPIDMQLGDAPADSVHQAGENGSTHGGTVDREPLA